MNTKSQIPLEPRKTPVQERSTVTVEAIYEATFQVLLAVGGPDRLTTTRVAERAGVSVGTLYQYFPNKQSLLLSALEKHVDRVVSAVELACRRNHGQQISTMIEDEVIQRNGRNLPRVTWQVAFDEKTMTLTERREDGTVSRTVQLPSSQWEAPAKRQAGDHYSEIEKIPWRLVSDQRRHAGCQLPGEHQIG